VKTLISASRRTDIPRYYARWFAERRREGFAEYRTAYGRPGRASLAPSDVLGYVFWTRDARRFIPELRALKDEGVPFAFQFTINGYPRSLEPFRPSVEGALASFGAISSLLPGGGAIQWRYDPIVLSEAMPAAYHVRQFAMLARELEGATRVVNTSIVEPYAKALRRVDDRSTRYRRVDPGRHPSVAKKYPDLPLAADAPSLLEELAAIARERGIELRVCSNPEYAFARSQCIGPDLFEPYGMALDELAPAPSRSACRCVRSVDIGMDETCVAGCQYCYVTTSQRSAVLHLEGHSPDQTRLRP
jgi:hypothetical protein